VSTEQPQPGAVGFPVEHIVRRVVDGEMPPALTPVLFFVRGLWRAGCWAKREDGICWQVEGTSWVEPSEWCARMERPSHWMPQPEAPNVAIKPPVLRSA
jgi:hypothetical protein